MSKSTETVLEEFEPTSQSELSRFVAQNFTDKQQPLVPVGGRTALDFGNPVDPGGRIVSLGQLTRTIDYPARDMTVTVEAGVRVDDLRAMLKKEGQQLPVDVSQSNRATIGGVIATNTSGPRRFGYGTLRDYVIGISAVDARGRSFKAGGRVVKNVAGYDLCKLLIGSLGTLAVISQVTLKLKPIPDSTATAWISYADFSNIENVLQQLTTTAARPVILDVLNTAAARQIVAETRIDLPCDSAVLIIGVEGSGRDTEWQIDTLKGELAPTVLKTFDVVSGEEATRLRNSLTEFPVSSEEPLTFQASLPPSHVTPFLEAADRSGVFTVARAGNGVVIGHLPDDFTTTESVHGVLSPLRELAEGQGGSLVVLHGDEQLRRDVSTFGTPPRSWALMRRLKRHLDPSNLLNPGRLFGQTPANLTG